MKKVFIDGSAGTTGLRIYERLEARADIRLITLSDADRKDPKSRKLALNDSDAAFLCLPDDAAREAVLMLDNPNTVLLDASTAHRTQPGWVYGFAELTGAQAQKIAVSKRIAVPGCYASGFVALVYPLIEAGLLPNTARVTCHAVSGYSGGGKKMIAQYEIDSDPLLFAPRQYALTQSHKHLKEMQAITGLLTAPIFCPSVANFYSGMEVTVPLFAQDLTSGKTADDIRALYAQKYVGPVVTYMENSDEDGFLSANALRGKDSMQISVYGNSERILLVSRFDNLGKGASGAAVQCLNLALGAQATLGLEI